MSLITYNTAIIAKWQLLVNHGKFGEKEGNRTLIYGITIRRSTIELPTPLMPLPPGRVGDNGSPERPLTLSVLLTIYLRYYELVTYPRLALIGLLVTTRT